MSTGLYSHTTRATGTVLTAAIYNGDHVNHITNQNPSMTGGYSDNVAQMQLTTDPGGTGSESLAGSLAGELERLRFAIDRLVGGANWHDNPGGNVGLVCIANGPIVNVPALDLILPNTAGIDSYHLILTGIIPAINDGHLVLLVSTDGGMSFHEALGDYDYVKMGTVLNDVGVFVDSEDTGNEVELTIETTNNDVAANGAHIKLDIVDAANTSLFTKIISTAVHSAPLARIEVTGQYTDPAEVDAIRLEFNNGNILSGRYALYARKLPI